VPYKRDGNANQKRKAKNVEDSISLYCFKLYVELQHHTGMFEFLPCAGAAWQGHLMMRLQLKWSLAQCFKRNLAPVLGYRETRRL